MQTWHCFAYGSSWLVLLAIKMPGWTKKKTGLDQIHFRCIKATKREEKSEAKRNHLILFLSNRTLSYFSSLAFDMLEIKKRIARATLFLLVGELFSFYDASKRARHTDWYLSWRSKMSFINFDHVASILSLYLSKHLISIFFSPRKSNRFYFMHITNGLEKRLIKH